jgi:hypothetical protein
MQNFTLSRRVRAAIAPLNVAAQPFLSLDVRPLLPASLLDVLAVFAAPQTATHAGSWAVLCRLFALLVLRTDPSKLSAPVGVKNNRNRGMPHRNFIDRKFMLNK